MKNAVLFAAVCVVVVVGNVVGQIDNRLVGKWCYDVPGDIFGFYSGIDCYEFRANGTFTETESGGFEFSGRWKANGNEVTMPDAQHDIIKRNYRFNREGTMLEMGMNKYRKYPTDAEKAAMKRAEEAEKARQAAIETAERAEREAKEAAERAKREAERAEKEAKEEAKRSITTFTDRRDYQVYKKVKLGGKWWMAKNLNYPAKNSVCYENKQTNCTEYGRLYDWETALIACPMGWHLPSDDEWTELAKFVIIGKTTGTKLKSTSGWNNNGNGTDDYGFSALPGGYYSANKESFIRSGEYGSWFSATESDAYNAWNYVMTYDEESLFRDKYGKKFFCSVRCVEGVDEAQEQKKEAEWAERQEQERIAREEVERARQERERIAQEQLAREQEQERQKKLEQQKILESYIAQGIEYHTKGKFEDAIKFYNMALELNQYNTDIREYLEMAKKKKKLKLKK